MSFHSIDYLLFLPVVVLFFFLFPPRLRWIALLVASNFFYGSWRIEFLALLWFTTLLDFVVALAMARTSTRRARKMLLGVSLASNLGLLCFFKYTALLAGTTFYDLRLGDFTLADVFLPLGISFYTFQTLGYTIDVYRGRRQPERHLGIFAVYVMYFPQLLAGPIERPFRLLPQLRQPHHFDLRRTAVGASLILVGYFKKLVIADNLGVILPDIFASPADYSALTVTLAAFGSLYRYYADLSGYADIAIGSSLIMGIGLSRNFNRPFASVSIAEFWQRWHITVTTWFRDYVYLPIARVSRGRWQRPVATVLTTFLIGLWHGASSLWIVAGLIGGLAMAGEGWVRKNQALLATSGNMLARVGIGQSGAMLVGRGANLVLLWAFLLFLGSMVNTAGWEDTFTMWDKMAMLPGDLASFSAGMGGFQVSWALIISIVLLEIYQWLDDRQPVFDRLANAGALIAWPFWYGLMVYVLLFGSFTSSDFIYFNF